MIRCRECGEAVELSKALVLWNADDGSDAVVVHQGRCDVRLFRKSGGAAYGRNWYRDVCLMLHFVKTTPPCNGLADLYAELERVGAA